jgi:DNA-binding NtrC family response regulator
MAKGIGLGHSIFYFDDNASQLDNFREMFSAEYDVHTATTLAQARGVLSRCDAEIIISDQVMPEIEGVEFLREASRACPGSVRILATGQVTVANVMQEVTTGIIHLFIRKPWTRAEMHEVLERADALLDEWGG